MDKYRRGIALCPDADLVANGSDSVIIGLRREGERARGSVERRNGAPRCSVVNQAVNQRVSVGIKARQMAAYGRFKGVSSTGHSHGGSLTAAPEDGKHILLLRPELSSPLP